MAKTKTTTQPLADIPGDNLLTVIATDNIYIHGVLTYRRGNEYKVTPETAYYYRTRMTEVVQ